MRIDRVELRKIHLPYVSPFETSGWRELGRYPVIVRIEADGLVAWGLLQDQLTATGRYPILRVMPGRVDGSTLPYPRNP